MDKPYTIPEFAEKHGLTIYQCKLAACRKKFDSILCKDVPIQRGGAKRFRLIYETEKTLLQVEKLKKNLYVGHTERGKSKTIVLKSGLEVLRNCLGLTMQGGESVISKYEY